MIRTTSLIAVLASLSLASSDAAAAGYVKAKVKNGDLILKGDSFRNVISVESVGGNQVVITGYEGTLINGYAQIYIGFSDDIKINLKDGDDYVYLGNVNVDDLKIKTSDGDDAIYLYACHIGDDLKVKSGDDDDTVVIEYSQIDGEMNVKLGEDDDYMGTHSIDARDEVNVRASDGEDYLSVSYSRFDDECEVDMGDDDDTLEVYNSTDFDDDAELDGGDDDDYLFLGFVYGDDIDVDDFETVVD